MNLAMSSEHWVFIPAVLFLGIVIGFLLAQMKQNESND